jgi:hypothetical protein
LLTGMIAGKEARQVAGQTKFGAVGEAKRGPRRDMFAAGQQTQVGVKRDRSEREDGSRAKQVQFFFEIAGAIGEFGGQGFVVGRRATKRGGDVSVVQRETVIDAQRSGLVREAGAVKFAVKKFAAAIAGEHSSSAIGPVGARRQAYNDQLRARISKTGDGTAPVSPIAIGPALNTGDLAKITNQARTLAALDDGIVERGQERFRC